MHIICLTPLAPGVYNDHRADHITAPPEGWAYIPEDFHLPSTFPRLGSIEAEELTYTHEVEVEKPVTKQRDTGEVDEDGNPIMEPYTEMEMVKEPQTYTMMTVTAMTEGTLPEPDLEQLAAEVRAQRDKLLAETDWTQVLDAPISAESREAFRVYRQALRDITEQEGFPEAVIWPEMPEVVKAVPDPVDTAVDALLGGDEA